MVTLDNIVKNVPDFNGDLKGSRVFYQTAIQGLALIQDKCAVFEKTLKAKTGYDATNLPADEAPNTELELGEVTFYIKSESRTKRPAYKTAVTALEGHLNGMGHLLATGRIITGIAKKSNQYYMDAEKLLETFEIEVANVLFPEVKHTITSTFKGDLAVLVNSPEKIGNILIPKSIGLYNIENARAYALLEALMPGLQKFIVSYEQKMYASEDKTPKGKSEIVEVGGGDAYKVTKSTSKGPDWAGIVRILLKIPGREKCIGEFNLLADEAVELSEKKKLLVYEIWEKQVGEQMKTYVSLTSVYERVQELKGEETLSARRKKIELTQLV